MATKSLDELTFNNRYTATLPADPSTEIRPREVRGASFSRVTPKTTAAPKIIGISPEMVAALELDTAVVDTDRFAAVMTGNEVLDGMDTYAACYGGHQFGNWAGQLGDGRAIALGEVETSSGEHYTLQLKGAGPTPYSRSADGLAVLRSSVREFLCSEAMHHLGVPTTRALSLALTGDQVLRDMFYNGNAAFESGAIVCRVAPSFVRFGNFELPSSRQDIDLLRATADHTIRTDFPHLGEPSPEVYAAWFGEIVDRTADMIVHWMRVGFVHGVMNTDNMSIHGLTIDYGPYGWLEDFDPNWTPNTTDAGRKRYRFGAQPAIAQWNLMQLANAIYPLIEKAEPLQAALDGYVERYQTGYQTMMANKLGLDRFDPEVDEDLMADLLNVLQLAETDMTIFYRNLADVDLAAGASADDRFAPLAEAYYVPEQLTTEVRSQIDAWLVRYADRVEASTLSADARVKLMNATNPKYVLRNYLAQLAIDKADAGDYAMITELLDVLRHPYDDQPGNETFAEKRPDWARTRPGCSMLSCSS